MKPTQQIKDEVFNRLKRFTEYWIYEEKQTKPLPHFIDAHLKFVDDLFDSSQLNHIKDKSDLFEAIDKILEGNYGSAKNLIERYINTSEQSKEVELSSNDKINEIITRLEDWQQRNGYNTDKGQLTDIIKDLREEAKVFSSNAVLCDSVCPKCKFEPMIKVDEKYNCEMCGYVDWQTVK